MEAPAALLTAGRGRTEEQWGTGWFDDSKKLAPMDAQRLAAAGLSLMRAHACEPRR